MSPDRPLRVGFFVNFVHLQGTYFRFHNLARALRELGAEVSVHAGDQNRRSTVRVEVRDGVPYHIVPTMAGGSIVTPFANPLNAIARGVRSYPPCDIAHLFQPFPSAFFAWRSVPSRSRFFDWDDLWVNGIFPKGRVKFRTFLEREIVRWFEMKLPRLAAATTVCSGFLENLARKRGATSVTKIINGVSPQPAVPQREARAALDLVHDALYVGFMGRTCNELPWCLKAFAAEVANFPTLRFALCGAPESALRSVPEAIRERIDYRGQLPPGDIPRFAAALDLGLLPLEDTAFNRSRLPIKLAEHLAGGAPVLCSEVGECATLAAHLPGVMFAGNTQTAWRAAFHRAVEAAARNGLQRPDPSAVERLFSWSSIAETLVHAYRTSLAEPARVVAIPA